MAYRKSSGSRPTHYIAITAKEGKGKYAKGPYVGLWEGDGERNSPLFRGSTKGKYLDELYDFIKEYGEEEVGFAIFESRGDRGSSRRERDDSDRDDSDRGSRRSSRDDDKRGSRNSRDDEPRGKRGSREDKEEPRGRGGKKSKDWFSDD